MLGAAGGVVVFALSVNRQIVALQGQDRMSVTHPDQGFDPGGNHLKPALAAALIMAVTVPIALAFTGLPR